MTEAQLLDGQAFNRLVVEKELQGKTWEQNGYIYTGFHGLNGYELYRTYGPKWRMLYQARRVLTNANAAGGVIIIDVTVATGKMAELVQVYLTGTTAGTAVRQAQIIDEDNAAMGLILYAATAATSSMSAPSIGTAATSSGNETNSTGIRFGPGQKLSFSTGAATGQANDTLTVGLTLLLPIEATATDINWDYSRSTNAANCTLAPSTISAANTLQAVLLP